MGAVVEFGKKYFKKLNELLLDQNQQDFDETIQLINRCRDGKGKLIFVGNGGSAAMASHLAVDFTKACSIRSVNFNEADLLTCFSNDYGYENWVFEALRAYSDPADLVFLISSSGASKNILNAAKFCIEQKIKFVTLSGFSTENPLKKLGQVNIWVDSKQYNFVEMAHHVWLVALVDYIALNNKVFD